MGLNRSIIFAAIRSYFCHLLLRCPDLLLTLLAPLSNGTGLESASFCFSLSLSLKPIQTWPTSLDDLVSDLVFVLLDNRLLWKLTQVNWLCHLVYLQFLYFRFSPTLRALIREKESNRIKAHSNLCTLKNGPILTTNEWEKTVTTTTSNFLHFSG